MIEPQWMQGAFNEYFDDFVTGKISYSDFCDAIEFLPLVPDEVKDNHRRSLELYLKDGDDVKEVFPLARLTND